MILCHHCHLVVRTCNISQTPAIQQSAFFSFLFSFFPSHNMLYSDLTLCNHRLSSNVLLGFLFRFLVSASLKTWSVMSKLLKPTGDSRGEVEGAVEPLTATPGQQSTQTVPSSRGWRAMNIQHSPLYHWTKQHINSHTRRHKEFTSLFFSDRKKWGGENTPRKPNSQHFVYHSAGILTQIHRGWVQPTSEFGSVFLLFFFPVSSDFCSLDKWAELHKDTCQLGE